MNHCSKFKCNFFDNHLFHAKVDKTIIPGFIFVFNIIFRNRDTKIFFYNTQLEFISSCYQII